MSEGLPIGSKVLAGSISLSPASIRGVMQELEERGLLTHPHTSAGRIPTDLGYRYYARHLHEKTGPVHRDPAYQDEIAARAGQERTAPAATSNRACSSAAEAG